MHKSLITLAVLSVLIRHCESFILKRSRLPLDDTLPRTGNVTQGLHHFVGNIITFDMFKEMFEKTYQNAGAEQKALQNFLFNQKDINRHNVQYTAGNVLYSRALWEHSDLSTEEVNKYMNGFIRPVITKSSTQETKNEVKSPRSLNWVRKGFVTKAEKQGLCGSCWSFSAIGAIEGQMFKKTGKLRTFSKQNLIDCNFNEDVGNYGCKGGDMVHAFNYLIDQNGLALEKLYPYKESDKFKCQYNESQSGSGWNITNYVSLSPCSEKSLKASLVKYGPIAIAVDASLATFQSYKAGVYFDPKCSLNIDHAVLLVGYGVDKKTGQKFWLVKNSYGDSWGEDGYIRIRRNARNHCGITEFAVVPIC